MRTIIVKIKNVYGQEKIYPICDHARTFARMLGQTTLTRENIKHIKDLNYTIEVQHETEVL